MKLALRLAGLELSELPVWVFDVERLRVVWANALAVELWRAASVAELLARDMSDASEATRTRLKGLLAIAREGGRGQDEWTLYPRGVPTTMRLHSSAIELDDGRTGLLFQAVTVDKGPDPELVRGIEALRHTSMLVTLLSAKGEVLMQNPAAARAFEGADFSAWFEDAAIPPAILQVAQTGEVFQVETLARGAEGERWHAIEARAVRDPMTGATAILVHQSDVTARRGAELDAEAKGRLLDELNRTLAVVEEQRRQILALSAPILDVGRSTLALPLIGALDQARSAEVADRLLNAIVARRAGSVILDLTGADLLDTASAEHLVKLAHAIQLLGARPVITGIEPAPAAFLARSGVDLSGVLILRSLREGLLACMARA